MKHLFAAAVVLLPLLTFPLLGAPDPDPEPETGPVSGERPYIFTYLVLDAPQKLSEEAMGEAMKGHFSNMVELAERGKLLISGPLAEPRIDPTYRGLYVFNAKTEREGRRLVSTDPAVKAGVFKPIMFTMTSGDPLPELTRLEKEDEARRLADPEIPDEWVGRRYILAVGPVDSPYERTGLVLVAATITPVEANPDADAEEGAKSLLWLDATEVNEASKLFKASDPGAWSFYGWYGSACIAQLTAVVEQGVD